MFSSLKNMTQQSCKLKKSKAVEWLGLFWQWCNESGHVGSLWEMAVNHKTCGRRLQSPLSQPPRCSQRPPSVTGNKNLLPLCGIMSNDARKAIKFCNKLHSSARVMKGIHRFHLRDAGTVLRHPAVVFTWWRAAVKGCFFLSLLLFLTVFDGNSVTNVSSTPAFWKSQNGCHTWFDLWAHLHPSAVEISCWLNRKKRSYRDKVLVHYFKDKNCINVLEIKLSSPNSHVMNDNGINSILGRLICTPMSSFLLHIWFKNKFPASQ